jgi:hypothetical protein
LTSGSSRRLTLCSFELATQRARLLLGCYRKGDAEDAEVYISALVTILGNYPDGVVLTVTDPRTGIAGESNFRPTIAEVRHACEEAMRPVRDEEARQARRAETEAVLGAVRAGEVRATFEDLSAKYPDVVGHSPRRAGAKPAMTEAERARALARLEARRVDFDKPLEVSDELRRRMEGES